MLDLNDEQERQNPPPSFTKKDLQKKLSSIEKRIGELQEQLVDIEENGDVALTDPDSKMMLVKNSGREVSHNVQIAVEPINHFIVAVDVTSEAIDREQLHMKKRSTSKREEENYTHPSACRQCAVLELCTKSPYRTIQDPKYQRFADRVDARTAQNKDLFRQRKCLAEHPSGTVKRVFCLASHIF